MVYAKGFLSIELSFHMEIATNQNKYLNMNLMQIAQVLVDLDWLTCTQILLNLNVKSSFMTRFFYHPVFAVGTYTINCFP